MIGLQGRNHYTLDNYLLSAESSLPPNSTQRKDISNVPHDVAQLLLCTVSFPGHAGTCSTASGMKPSSLVPKNLQLCGGTTQTNWATGAFELTFCENFKDEIWNNFGIQLRS